MNMINYDRLRQCVSVLPSVPHFIISYLVAQINELRSKIISLVRRWWQFKWKISYLLWADRWVGVDGWGVGGELAAVSWSSPLLCTSVYTIVTQDPVQCWEWAYSVTWIYSKLQQGSSEEKMKSSNNFTAISPLQVSISAPDQILLFTSISAEKCLSVSI